MAVDSFEIGAFTLSVLKETAETSNFGLMQAESGSLIFSRRSILFFAPD
jgi:hypothetical protein